MYVNDCVFNNSFNCLDITGDYKFVSATYRLFKIPKGNTKFCQVMYNGDITGVESCFKFDCHYTFKVNVQ